MQFRGIFVWIILFYFHNNLSNMHFKTNSSNAFHRATDPRQRVPLMYMYGVLQSKVFKADVYMYCALLVTCDWGAAGNLAALCVKGKLETSCTKTNYAHECIQKLLQ